MYQIIYREKGERKQMSCPSDPAGREAFEHLRNDPDVREARLCRPDGSSVLYIKKPDIANIPDLDASWLHGKYANGEINTKLSYVAVNDPEFYAQGDDADQIIEEMRKRWNASNLTQEKVFNEWVSMYL